LQPIKEVASMLKRRFENIITYLRHRITNAASESLNAKIQWVKYTARGFRNKEFHARDLLSLRWSGSSTVIH
jgi:transposase